MEPILLVHGYSAESAKDNEADVARIFGSLPDDLRANLPREHILDINISRYISLDDRVDIEDITLAFDRALKNDFSELYSSGFNAIVHSTGALVLRNWVRRCCEPKKPSPSRRIIYLAGANLGSGWAHLGESEIAKWLRFIVEGGSERGLAFLSELELGSNWAWELHYYFLQPGQAMLADYQVMEFSLVGSQPPLRNFIAPIRYAKEDGSDGVVRVASSNLNHIHVRIGPAQSPVGVDWNKAVEFSLRTVAASADGDLADFTSGSPFAGDNYYRLLQENCPGEHRPGVPFAIPYNCAHTAPDVGIVSGAQNRQLVMPLIGKALNCTRQNYSELAAEFEAELKNTYEMAADEVQHRERLSTQEFLLSIANKAAQFLEAFSIKPQAQYDRHAQVSVRVRDQHGSPIENYSVHFNSFGGGGRPNVLINDLFEDTHQNRASPDTITFYLRLEKWEPQQKTWINRLNEVNGVDLEIDCIDPKTQRITFVPLRMRLNAAMLARYLQPHRATLIDVELLRLPARETFSIFPFRNRSNPEGQSPATGLARMWQRVRSWWKPASSAALARC